MRWSTVVIRAHTAGTGQILWIAHRTRISSIFNAVVVSGKPQIRGIVEPGGNVGLFLGGEPTVSACVQVIESRQ